MPNGVENIFSGFNHVFVVEMNDEGLYGYGQFAGLLRARYCDPKIRGINKTDGLTWKVKATTNPHAADETGAELGVAKGWSQTIFGHHEAELDSLFAGIVARPGFGDGLQRH